MPAHAALQHDRAVARAATEAGLMSVGEYLELGEKLGWFESSRVPTARETAAPEEGDSPPAPSGAATLSPVAGGSDRTASASLGRRTRGGAAGFSD